MGRDKDLSAILEAIASRDRFVVTSHVMPDGDCICSLLAFRRLLLALSKTCCITYTQPVPQKYRFLADSPAIRDAAPEFSPDVVAVLDVANRERTALEKGLLGSVPLVINVDHHASNTRFGALVLVDENACATCAVIYRMYQVLGVPIDGQVAQQLFCGIMTDTGRLSFANANTEAFSICADLVGKGANPDQIAREVYFQEDFALARLRGRVLSSLELSGGGKICSMTLSRDVAKWAEEHGPGPLALDTEGLVDYAVWIRGVEMGILFKWSAKDVVKVSFRSGGAADVNKFAALFGGGGHRMAAGCTLAGSLADVKRRILTEAERWVKQ